MAASTFNTGRSSYCSLRFRRSFTKCRIRQMGLSGVSPCPLAMNQPLMSVSVREGESAFASRQWRRIPVMRAWVIALFIGRRLSSSQCGPRGERVPLLGSCLGQKAWEPVRYSKGKIGSPLITKHKQEPILRSEREPGVALFTRSGFSARNLGTTAGRLRKT